MDTLTVRIDKVTHNKIKELSNISHQNMLEIMNQAVNKYYREVFWKSVNASFKRLKENEIEYQDELDERKLWDNTLLDGLEGE